MAQRRQQQRRGAVRRADIRADRRDKRQSRKRARRYIYLGVSGFIGFLIIISLFVPTFQGGGRTGDAGQLAASAVASQIIPEGTDYFGYDSNPPTYGPHWPTGATWGIHTEDIRDERQVRNLAEGGVLIQYNTEDQELIDKLTEFAERQANYPCYVIVAPYPGMTSSIAATAWGTMDSMDEYDADRLQRFVDSSRGQGPTPIPCTP